MAVEEASFTTLSSRMSAVITTLIHILTLVADNFVHFSWTELFVPGASPWKTTPVALGVVAFCLYLTYGSLMATAILMVPVVFSQFLCEAVMVIFNIDLNVNSLPVAAAGARRPGQRAPLRRARARRGGARR